MFVVLEDEYIVRVPPELLGGGYDEAVISVTKTSLEGKLIDYKDPKDPSKILGKCYVVSITEVEQVGDGVIVHGDGGVYQSVKFKALTFYPELQEIVEGTVVSVKEFGAFVRFGPFEGLLHKGQIMDDRIDVDLSNQRFIGKDTKRDLKVGDKVRVKIVHLNLKSSSVEDSTIGFTMKQIGLGKLQWLERKVAN
ncbi:DNA-directed RNA polymerase [Thermoplasmatales archaeon AK]|nr:DNA-directed RNA polymerase [Thermoplasmatales archaeon AK]